MTLVLRYFTRSDRGLVRSNNEDSAYAGARLLALADGMGGHAAGEVASQLVIEALSSLDADEPGGDLLGALERATRAGNEAIAAQVERSPELEGMGTTLTAILFAGNRIGLCHIGDSRGYMYRDGQISQITRDDTFVQTLVDEGRITAEQAHTHPQRSLIMRALTGTEVEPTLTVREARAGDRYLLCSDGLSDVVTEETLAETLGSFPDPRECADRLIELALRGGGPDNVTVVIGDVIDTEYGESRPIVGGAAGGNEDAYTPNPTTAAGRAAALRPPPSDPQRPSVLEEPAPARKRSHLRRWLSLAVAALVVIALVVGFFVFRAVVYSNYYASADEGNVVINQGSPDEFLFRTMSRPAEKVCITSWQEGKIEFTSSNNVCQRPLRIGDLQQAGVASINGHSIKNLSLQEVQNSINRIQLLPPCRATEPTPPQGPSPRTDGIPSTGTTGTLTPRQAPTPGPRPGPATPENGDTSTTEYPAPPTSGAPETSILPADVDCRQK